jgi:hypothetical protein
MAAVMRQRSRKAPGYLGGLDLLARSRAEYERSRILRADLANQRTVALRWRAKGIARREQCSLGEAYDDLLIGMRNTQRRGDYPVTGR